MSSEKENLPSPLVELLSDVRPVFRPVGDEYSFVAPAFQEVLTASDFARAINSGQISVREAYEQFWSYEEDEKLWGVKGRVVLPAWRNILNWVYMMLKEEKKHNFKQVFHDFSNPSYRVCCYNPFKDNAEFVERVENNVRYLEDTIALNKPIENPISQLMDESLDVYALSYLLDQIDDYVNKRGLSEDDAAHIMNFVKFSYKGDLDENSDNLEAAVSILGKNRSKKTISFLEDLLTREVPEDVHRAAIDSLGEIGTDEAVSVLLDYFHLGFDDYEVGITSEKKDKEIYGSVIQALGKTKSEKAVCEIIKEAERFRGRVSSDVHVWSLMVNSVLPALAASKSKVAVEYLDNLITVPFDDEPYWILAVQKQAIYALGEIGDALSVDILSRLLLDPKRLEEVNVWDNSIIQSGIILDAIKKASNPKSIPALLEYCNSECEGGVWFKKAAKILADYNVKEVLPSCLRWADSGNLYLDHEIPLIASQFRDPLVVQVVEKYLRRYELESGPGAYSDYHDSKLFSIFSSIASIGSDEAFALLSARLGNPLYWKFQEDIVRGMMQIDTNKTKEICKQKIEQEQVNQFHKDLKIRFGEQAGQKSQRYEIALIKGYNSVPCHDSTKLVMDMYFDAKWHAVSSFIIEANPHEAYIPYLLDALDPTNANYDKKFVNPTLDILSSFRYQPILETLVARGNIESIISRMAISEMDTLRRSIGIVNKYLKPQGYVAPERLAA